MMLLKIHEDGVVSLCDSELIGKTFEDEKLQLIVSERFYKGKEATKEEIVEALKDSKTANIVGKESVELAIKEDIITADSVKYIGDVPHAQIFSL